MTTDLHCHSTASDGEHAPSEVVAAALRAGITMLALTDHDTIAGVPEAVQAARNTSLKVVTGCEFSVRVGWGEMHLLGYFLPSQNEELESFLAGQRESRLERAREMVSRLKGVGVDVSLDDVKEIAAGGAIGRPHVARALVRASAVPDINAAFDRYIGFRRSAFVPKDLPLVENVTRLISSLGGISSAAHLREKATKKALQYLKKSGVDALEVRHPSHGLELRETLSLRAVHAGMLRTGGTDWHGESMAYEGGRLGEIEVPSAWFRSLQSLHEKRVSG